MFLHMCWWRGSRGNEFLCISLGLISDDAGTELGDKSWGGGVLGFLLFVCL